MATSNLLFRLLGKDDASEAFLKAAASARALKGAMSDLGTSTLGITKLIGAAGLIPAATAGAAAVTELSVAAIGAGGALGVLGLAIGGQVKEMTTAHQNIATLTKKVDGLGTSMANSRQTLDGMTKGTTKYKQELATVQARTTAYHQGLKQLQTAQKAYNQQFGPAAKGMDNLSNSWHRFLDLTSHSTLGVMGKGLNLAAGILPRLVPIANNAADAVGKLLGQFGKWTRTNQFQAVLNWLGTSGVKDLVAFVHIGSNVIQGLGGILANFVGPGDRAAKSLQNLTARFAVWGKSKGVSESVNKFLDYVSANGPAITGALSSLATIMPKLAVSTGQLGTVNLGIVQKGLALIAKLPQSVFNDIADGLFLIALASKAVTAAMAVRTWILGAAAALTVLNDACIGTRIGLIRLAIQEKIVAVATKAWAAAQWLMNAALDANPIGIVVIALAALAAGLVYAYTHSAKFRAIVKAALRDVEVAGRAVGNFFAHTLPQFFEQAWNKIKGASLAFVHFFTKTIPAGVQQVLGWIRGHWPLIVGILTGPIGIAVAEIAKHWSAIVSGAKSAVQHVAGAFGSLLGKIQNKLAAVWAWLGKVPSLIISAIGDLSHVLWNAGQQVVNGLIGGIKSKAGDLAGAVKGLAGSIAGSFTKHMQIHSPSRLMRKLGTYVVDGLVLGLQDGTYKLQRVLDKVTSLVQKWGGKLHDAISARNTFAGGFSSFSQSIFGADYGTDADGNAIAPTVQSILAKQRGEKAKAKSLSANVHKLLGMGLSKSLIQQMQAAGDSGVAEINALASGASVADIKALNRANSDTYMYDNRAGMAAGNAIYGKSIARDREQEKLAKRLERAFTQALKEANKDEHLVAEISGSQLRIMIRKDQRAKGQKTTV